MPEPIQQPAPATTPDPSKVSWEQVKAAVAEDTDKSTEGTEAKAEAAPDGAKEDLVDYEAELKKRTEALEREKTSREYEREERKKLQAQLNRILESKGGKVDADDILSAIDNVDLTDADEPDEPPKKVSKKDLTALVEEKVFEKIEVFKKEQASNLIDDILLSLSDNETERALIKAVYEQDLRPRGYTRDAIQSDLEKAYLIANKGRYASELEKKAEARLKQSSAQTKAVTNASAGSGNIGRPSPEPAPQYNEREMELLKRVGKNKADNH